MYDRRMRSVDLAKLDFDATEITSFPLDRVRAEDIEDRSADFPAVRIRSEFRPSAGKTAP